MMKKLLIFLLTALMLIVSGCGSSDKSSSTTSTQSTTPKITMEQKKQASEEVMRILTAMPQETDEVEKLTWYKPYEGQIQPHDAIQWYAGKKGDHVWMRAQIINFTSDVGWVFWDKLIFSTSERNWEYQIKDCFAGQTGGGKLTQVVYGGKYEMLDVPFDEIQEGYRLFVTGKNPILRLQGKEHYYDYRLTENDINHLQTGIYVYDQLKVCDNKIVQ